MTAAPTPADEVDALALSGMKFVRAGASSATQLSLVRRYRRRSGCVGFLS